ncbi:MAG: HAMP domain-containing protein [Coleofasciculaceae cyanobacterium]
MHEYAKAGDRAWLSLKTSYREATVKELMEELEIFQSMLRKYDGVTQEYVQLVDNLFPTVETETEQPINPAALPTVLIELDKHSLSPQFHEFIENSQQLFESVLQEEREVEASLEKVQWLKTQIIIISLILSVAIATVLAVLTRRLIVYPIETTTRVAQQVTEEDNFDLQAPILSQDEIGVLTTALNELIQRVKYLMLQQKMAEAQLIQSEKMSSLGQIVAGVAHEINIRYS